MKKRIVAIIIDIIIISLVTIPIFAIGFVKNLTNFYILLISLFVSAFLCKYILNGQSLGKRLMRIRVVCEFKRMPKDFPLMLRNLPLLLLFPIELILFIFNKDGRRLGDYLAETMAIESKHNTQHTVTPNRIVNFLLCFTIISILLLILDAYTDFL